MKQAVMQVVKLGLIVSALSACVTTSPNSTDGPRIAEQPVSQKTATGDTQQRAKVHTELGALYVQDNRLPIALEEARIAIEADPGYAPAYNLLGLVHMYLEETGPAEEAFRRALSLAPNDPEINNNYGWFLCQTKREAASIQHFKLAYRNTLYATPTKPYTNAGICLLRVKDYAAAEQHLSMALRYDPNNTQALYWLGELYLQTGRLAEARTRVQDLTRIIEPTAEVLWLGARIEHKQGDRDAETRYTSQLRKRFPNSVENQKFTQGQFE